jgi:hypothetical protein
VVEHSTADRNVPSSTLGAPYRKMIKPISGTLPHITEHRTTILSNMSIRNA